MSDYTPSLAQAAEMYAIARTPYLTRKTWFASREEPIRIALSEFERMIAKVRAEAYEAAEDAAANALQTWWLQETLPEDDTDSVMDVRRAIRAARQRREEKS